jgi:hypothetical protein
MAPGVIGGGWNFGGTSDTPAVSRRSSALRPADEAGEALTASMSAVSPSWRAANKAPD